MKKKFSFAAVCLLALMAMIAVSCHKEDDYTPVTNDTTVANDTVPDTPEPTPSILGKWKLDSAIQNVSGNEIDITNFYGYEFFLTFLEDGTLITSDGINDVEMQWTLDGDQLGFIQVPGAAPVMYLVEVLDTERLVIVNGAGSDYVTTMTLHRVE